MTGSESAGARIVRWEGLPGLPGDGPIPKHFHAGHPTPWREGFAVRFRNADGTEWIGNFQTDGTGLHRVFGLPDAEVVIVVAGGFCYFVSTLTPDDYRVPHAGVTSALLSDEGNTLLIARAGGDLVAYDRNGGALWNRTNLSTDGIVLKCCEAGIITLDIEYDYAGSWRTHRVLAKDGRDVDSKDWRSSAPLTAERMAAPPATVVRRVSWMQILKSFGIGMAATTLITGLASAVPSIFGFLTAPFWIVPAIAGYGAHEDVFFLKAVSGTVFYAAVAFLVLWWAAWRKRVKR